MMWAVPVRRAMPGPVRLLRPASRSVRVVSALLGEWPCGGAVRSVSTRPKSSTPLSPKRLHEAIVVTGCGSTWMKLLGNVSIAQLYVGLIMSGNLIFRAEPGADYLELAATSGAIMSASASAYFAAKLLCERVVTEIASCRQVGDKDEFVRVTVLGGLARKKDLVCQPSDLKLLAHDGKDAYKFALGGRKLELDVATGECANRKALEMLLQGKPLVVKKTKQGKKRSRQ